MSSLDNQFRDNLAPFRLVLLSFPDPACETQPVHTLGQTRTLFRTVADDLVIAAGEDRGQAANANDNNQHNDIL